MKERINKLARGIVDLACPELRLSDTAFHGMVCAGETLKLDLTLTSENGILLKGLIYSDSPYVTLQKNTFLGLRTRISALVDARALEDGDHIEGGLCIVSNGGETRIPFAFEVRSYASAEVIPGLRTPEDFVKLYQTNGGAALRVFEYDDFVRAPFMNDARFRALYDGLRKGPDRVHALEAFLYAIRYPKQETTTRVPRAESGCTKETLNRADVPVEELEDAELIEAAAGCCIRAGATTELAFRIYQRAIEMQSQITRLYEYYMYAMPKGYQGRLPREVYLYFDYEYDRIWQDNDNDKMMMAAYNANKITFLPGQYKIKDQPMILCDAYTPGAKKFTYNGQDYYYENNGFGKFDNDDKVVYQKSPKFSFGLTNTLTYKDFALSFFIYGRFGNTYYGLTQTIGRRVENDTWSPTNTGAKFAQPTTATRTTAYDYVRNYCKGDMVMVRNISLSYNVPKLYASKIGANTAQVYAQVLNPFLFGGELVKAGINPDDITGWDAGNHIGGQTNNTCITRSFVLGVRLGF